MTEEKDVLSVHNSPSIDTANTSIFGCTVGNRYVCYAMTIYAMASVTSNHSFICVKELSFLLRLHLFASPHSYVHNLPTLNQHLFDKYFLSQWSTTAIFTHHPQKKIQSKLYFRTAAVLWLTFFVSYCTAVCNSVLWMYVYSI